MSLNIATFVVRRRCQLSMTRHRCSVAHACAGRDWPRVELRDTVELDSMRYLRGSVEHDECFRLLDVLFLSSVVVVSLFLFYFSLVRRNAQTSAARRLMSAICSGRNTVSARVVCVCVCRECVLSLVACPRSKTRHCSLRRIINSTSRGGGGNDRTASTTGDAAAKLDKARTERVRF